MKIVAIGAEIMRVLYNEQIPCVVFLQISGIIYSGLKTD